MSHVSCLKGMENIAKNQYYQYVLILLSVKGPKVHLIPITTCDPFIIPSQQQLLIKLA